MNFKERLFGPRWEHKDSAVRARAVLESDDPRIDTELPRIAREDEASDVRLAALRRLDREDLWIAASSEDPDPGNRRHADRSILRSVVGDETSDVAPRLSWLARMEDPEIIRHVARNGSDRAMREAALERIQAQGYLGDCYLDEPDNGLAEKILQRIDQPSTLERVIGKLRTRRKDRHRAATGRLAEIRAAAGDTGARDAGALALVEAMEALARGEHLAERSRRLEELEAAWKALPERTEPLERRFNGARRIVAAAMKPREPSEPAAPEPESRTDSSDPELLRLTEAMRGLATAPLGKKTGSKLARLCADFSGRLEGLGLDGEVPDDDNQRLKLEFEALAGEIRARIEAAGKAPEPSPLPGPAAPTETETETETEAETDADTRTDGPDKSEGPDPDALEALIEAAAAALESGDVGRAHQAVSEARSFHDRLPKRQQPRGASGRLQRMGGRLKEMRDWQHWSNNKLRERLIQRVEEIDPAEQHPDAITARLKEIRGRWQALEDQEVLPGDKRKFAAPPGQWRRFQAACKQAFDAAKPWFEKREAVQKQELETLASFLDEARKVSEDEGTDTGTLTRYQRAARQAIRNLDALPPRKRGPMARRLRDLMDKISARLEAGFEAIELDKRRLIAEARKLAHETDRKAAIDRAKALQAEWKRVGATRRSRENALWKEFREPIDPLFEDLKTEARQRKEEDQELRKELEDLCKRIEEIAALPEAELETAQGQMNGLVDEWLGRQVSIPPLRKRFDRAREKFQARLEDLDAERQRRAADRLEALAERVQAAWETRLGGQQPELAEAEDAGNDPVATELAGRLQQFTSPDADTGQLETLAEANTDAARQVAVEMEFLAGLESPAEDRQQRMDYQVKRLSSRLGEGAPKPDLASERLQLIRRRLLTFPRDPDRGKALDKRFAAAEKIIKNMIST